MTGFEFAMIPVAIVIGFALTRLLNDWAYIIAHWSSFDKPGLFLSLTLFFMIGTLSHFVGDWPFREIEMGFGRLFLIILPTLVMILAIAVMVPEPAELPLNLEAHYFERIRLASGLMVLGILLSVLPDHFPGVVGAPPLWMVCLFLAPLIVLAFFRHKPVHIVAQGFIFIMTALQLSGITDFGQIQ